MDEQKIAFIICVNHSECYEECVRYISDLLIPDGYCTDVLAVYDAESMAKGYNEGMGASDAKYKVYLREDTFILNREFITEALAIFRQDNQIGMLGVVGTDKIPADADCCANWNIGSIMDYDGRCIKDTPNLHAPSDEYADVEAIDGVLMMTQYDVQWREDFLDGWSFYDVSQSIEMKRQGYRIVVPRQKQPWCYRDNGILDMRDYDSCRDKMIQAYPEVFSGTTDEKEREKRKSEWKIAEETRNILTSFMSLHLYDNVREMLGKRRCHWISDMQVHEIINLMEIYILEEDSVENTHSEWFGLQDWSEIYAYYQQVQWILLRLGFEREDDRIHELKKLVDAGRISRDAIRKIANISLQDTSGVFRYFWEKKENAPLVSVCVLVYNGAAFVHETIESVLKQTYSNIEFLIVDDCSTDNSREIIEAYHKKDERIKTIFLEKNSNVCTAGNCAFEKARGKYIAIIGHDDVWKPDKLEKQVAFLEEHPDVGACFTWIEVIDDWKSIVSYKNYLMYQAMNVDNDSTESWLRQMILYKSNWACAPSVCIRRTVLERTGYYRYGLLQLQDYDLWLRILCQSSIYVLQDKLTWYRKFNGKKNLSNLAGTTNRLEHEKWWVISNMIEQMTDEQFLKVFRDDLKWQDASGHEAALCEKAFLLWSLGGSLAERNFMELLESAECRDILERKYQFTLNDFYAMNNEA